MVVAYADADDDDDNVRVDNDGAPATVNVGPPDCSSSSIRPTVSKAVMRGSPTHAHRCTANAMLLDVCVCVCVCECAYVRTLDVVFVKWRS